MAPPQPFRYRFGHCLLDLARRELLVHGQVTPLQARAFDMLALLASRPGEVITKDQLVAAVWPTVHVSDAVLASAAARIRRAIDDQASAPMLKTVHGVGYRLDASVTTEAAGSGQATQAPTAAPGPPHGSALQVLAASLDGAYWEALWTRGDQLEAQGEVASALALLETARAHVTLDAPRWQLLARARRQRLQLELAEEALAAGLSEARDDSQRAGLLLERAQVALQRFDTPAALDCAGQVAEGIATGRVDTALLPALLVLQARCAGLQEAFNRVPPLVARVRRAARLPQDAALLARAAGLAARAAAQQGLQETAAQEAAIALALARQHALPRETCDAFLALAFVAHHMGALAERAECACRAVASIGDQSDLHLAQTARLALVRALVNLGRIDEARQAFTTVQALGSDSESQLTRYNVAVAGLLLDWRGGRASEALARLGALIDEQHQSGMAQKDLTSLHAFWALGLGQPEPARRLLTRGAPELPEYQAAQLQAGLALHEGDRPGARAALRRAWGAQPDAGGPMRDVLLALAFMAVEDDSQGPELEGLLATLRAHAAQDHGTQFLEAALAYKREPTTAHERALLATARLNCGLGNRHSWLLTRPGLRQWLGGERCLAEVLPFACL